MKNNMKEEQQYAYWHFNVESALENSTCVYNCSACGYESSTSRLKTCPECSAIMVEILGNKKAIDGRDICSGDIVKCDVVGVVDNNKIEGKMTNDSGQWRLETPYLAAFAYDCDNIEIIQGMIPEGQYLNTDFLNSKQNRR